jgi:hypothetical protein
MLKYVKGLTLIATVALLSACGQNNLSSAFKNVSIAPIDQNGNTVVTLSTEVGANNIVFSAMSFPITAGGKEYGTVNMSRTVDGKNLLTVSADISGLKLAHTLSDNKLPNGADVPVTGLKSLIAAQAGTNSRIYVGTSDNTLVFGAAIAIEQFDNLSKYIPGATTFFNLNGANGMGGFFTSAESGKSGLAIFVQTTKPAGISALSAKPMADAGDVKFKEKKATMEQAQYFGYFVNQWSKRKTQLLMH